MLRPTSFVHIRIGQPLLLGDLHGRPDLNQRPFSDPGAIFRRTVPLALALD